MLTLFVACIGLGIAFYLYFMLVSYPLWDFAVRYCIISLIINNIPFSRLMISIGLENGCT